MVCAPDHLFQKRQILRPAVQPVAQAFHFHGQDPVFRLQLIKRPRPFGCCKAPDIQPRIRGAVPEQAYRSDPAQNSPLFVSELIRKGIRCAQKLPRQVPACQIIVFPRPFLVMDHQLACGIKLLQHGSCGLCVSLPVTAPVNGGMPVYFPLDGKIVRAYRTVLLDIFLCQNFKLRKLRKLPPALPRGPSVALKTGPVPGRQNREILVRIIHQPPVLIEQLAKHPLRESLYPGLKGKLRIFSAGIHRIKLNTARLPDKGKRPRLSLKPVFSKKSLLQKHKLPRLAVCQPNHKPSLHQSSAHNQPSKKNPSVRSPRPAPVPWLLPPTQAFRRRCSSIPSPAF